MFNRKMLRQTQAMQKKIQEMQEEIAQATTEASVGGGAVKAVVVGGSRVESIEIDPDVVDPEDVEMLQQPTRNPKRFSGRNVHPTPNPMNPNSHLTLIQHL